MNYRRWMHYPPYAVLANVRDPERETGGGYGVVECVGVVVSAHEDGEGSRAGSGCCADSSAEEDLPVSLCAEGGTQADTGRGSTRNAGGSLRRRTFHVETWWSTWMPCNLDVT